MRSADKNKENDDGYIVIETVGAFIPFLLLVISILSLVNIVALQARMHHALTQAACALSMYGYGLEVTGVANNLTSLANKSYRLEYAGGAIKDDISSVMRGINAFTDGSDAVTAGNAASAGVEAAKRIYDWGEEIVDDPVGVLQLFLNYGVSGLLNRLFEELARPLVGSYLANGDLTGDEYLRRAGVVSTNGTGVVGARGLAALRFHDNSGETPCNSVMIDRHGNVKLVVHYEVEYTFGGLKLPFSPTLKITQTVVTKAWLNGSGRGYWGW